MKHPVRDRILMLLCAAIALCAAAFSIALVAGQFTFDPIHAMLNRLSLMDFKAKAALCATAVILIFLALLLIGVTLPARKQRSSSFAVQRNENGMVRISLKALEALVQKCLNEHAELKVITSSMFSDEESIRVDVHISLQPDISMPLAISALQKQVKKYLEACSGVMVQEVRVFVDSTMPASDAATKSPYAIPASLLGLGSEPLPAAQEEKAADASAEMAEAAVEETEAVLEETPIEEMPMEENTEDEQLGEQAREEEQW